MCGIAGTGLYSRLEKYNLPEPEAIFDVDYFNINPFPFFDIARSIIPRELKPTRTHSFLRMLHDKGVLQRIFTQNIDALELQAGVPASKIVECHGSFATATCQTCFAKYDLAWLKKQLFPQQEGRDGEDEVRIARCDVCQGVVKPGACPSSSFLPLHLVLYPAVILVEQTSCSSARCFPPASTSWPAWT